MRIQQTCSLDVSKRRGRERSAKRLEQVPGCLQLLAMHIVIDPESSLLIADQASVAQDFEVVRNGGLAWALPGALIGETNDAFEITDADVLCLLAQDIEDMQPGRIR